MKYLQDGSDRQEYAARSLHVNKKPRQHHTRMKEEDISAFFTSNQPAVPDAHENIAPRNDCPSNSASKRQTACRGEARETPDRPLLDRRIMGKDDRASKPRTSSRRRSHDTTSYTTWSESIRLLSTAPKQSNTTSMRREERVDIAGGGYAEGQYGRQMTVDPEMPSLGRSEPATTPTDPAITFSVDSRCSRLQSPPQRYSSLQSPELYTRIANVHATEFGASPQSMQPVLETCIAADLLAAPVGERSKRPYSSSEATRTPRPGSAHTAQRFVSCDSLRLPTKMDDIPWHHSHPSPDNFGQNFGQVRTRVIGPARTCVAQELPDTTRQTGRIPYRGCAEGAEGAQASAVWRLIAPSLQVPGLSKFSAPTSFFVQQEQQQLSPPQYDVEGDDGCQYAEASYAEYVCESDLLCQEDFEDVSAGIALDQQIEIFDIGHEELGRVADTIMDQGQKCERNGVVGPGFWQPHKLY